MPLAVSAQGTVGMKDAFEGKFLMGCAINQWHISQQVTPALKAVKKHYNSLVAENCMKAEELQPMEGTFNFKHADEFVDFAEENNMHIVGHCLVWHSQCPAWMFQGKWRREMSRELLKDRMRDHIYTVVGRYKGRVKGWDVVNEAINDDGTFRKSPYYNILGEEFIELAFKFAHEADPDAELYYNDYSTHNPAKREAIVRLIKKLQSKGCRIDAVGMQSHVAFDTPLDEYEKTIEAFAATGIKVQVTELDLSVLPWPQQGMGAAVETSFQYRQEIDPYVDGLPADMQQKQCDFYNKLFSIYLRHASDIKRITFWGVLDSDSWKNNWPITGRTDYPLPFYDNGKEKPFVEEIMRLAKPEIFPANNAKKNKKKK